MANELIEMSTPETTSSLTFAALREANMRRWKTDPRYAACTSWSHADWVTALVGEVGELANMLKKIRRGDFDLDTVREDVAREVADIQTYLDILAAELGVDLGVATVAKFNEVSLRIGSAVRLGGESTTSLIVGDDTDGARGYMGTVIGGNGSTVGVGDRGKVVGGDGSIVSAGHDSVAIAGYDGVAEAGDRGVAISGFQGVSRGGHGSFVIGGSHGRATTGDLGIAVVQPHGKGLAGNESILLFFYWDKQERERCVAAYTGENGIQPGRWYQCLDGKVEEVR